MCDMTLRDYFAACALQVALAADVNNRWRAEDHAKDAYAVADAMMKERETQCPSTPPKSASAASGSA